MTDTSDAHLQLKKRARRRLVGAVAFAGLAAVVLPMVMDQEPRQQVQDVQIRIPGEDQTPFNPKALNAKVAEKVADKAAEKPSEKVVEKPAEKPVDKAPEKAAEKPADIPVSNKPVEKKTDKPVAKPADDQARAAAVLAGKAATTAPAAGNGQYVILIGAFANPANVQQLQTKIGELGIKVFTEPLDSPEGKKTRVRAGPFPNRDAADKALEKMKRIGVNGVIAAKQ